MAGRKSIIDSLSGALTRAVSVLFLAAGISIGIVMLFPPSASAAQGYWRGSPVDPGFDRNTVILVTGNASNVNMTARGGPGSLSLQTRTERFTVILAPGWFLNDLRADIRNGDVLVVEGAKMMDRRGNLHLVAAQVTNRRSGAVLRLRDESGFPLWRRAGCPGRRR
jgi:hypothetical protein